MGLDIYLHRTRFQGGYEVTEKNYKEIINSEEKRLDGELSKDYGKCIQKLTRAELKKVDKDTYAKIHKECIDSLKKHFSFPKFDLDELGYKEVFKEWDNPNEHDTYGYYEEVYEAVPVNEWINQMDKIIETHYAPSVCYFRKVNLLFAYFENKGTLIEQYFAFMDKNTCLDIIDRCEKVLKNPELASELLPTQSGFFFGSTDYNEYYFKDVADVLKQLTEKALPIYDEPCWKKGQVSEEYENEKMNTYWIFSW
jgi:hypothetical protein